VAEGYVYVLINEAMPGYVKIGFTQQDDLNQRLRQLDNTSTPMPFECHYAAKVPDCRKLERTLHFVFGEKRTRANREFFKTDPDLAKAIIELVAIEVEAVSDPEQAITPEQRSEIEAVRTARAQRTTLEDLGLRPGTVLTFTKDPSVTCEVVGPRTVRFRGEEMSLSQAGLRAVREMGYNWPSVRGADYWAWEGRKLSALEAVSSGE
jgi:hypothetical protein